MEPGSEKSFQWGEGRATGYTVGTCEVKKEKEESGWSNFSVKTLMDW